LIGRSDETGAGTVSEEQSRPAGEQAHTAQPVPSGTEDVPNGAAMTKEADLLSEIVSLPPVRARQTMVQPVEGARARVGRWIVYALLIALVTVPLLLGRPLLSRSVRVGPGALGLYEAIESLDSGAAVLVAFDYDPATSGEMDVVARAIVGHLMDRRTRIIAVSLLPAGAATAQGLLDSLAREREGYRDGYGQSYANLGFVPGQAAAVRLLAQSLETAVPSDYHGTPLSQSDIAEGLYGARDFDLIVELAATPDSMRWWIEQAAAPLDVPVGAGVSAWVAPWVKPYFETEPKLLVGLLGGVSDAAMYDAHIQGQDLLSVPVSVRLDSQLAGHVLLVCLILVGNGVYLVRRSKGRKG
jgi:hypothetical protein